MSRQQGKTFKVPLAVAASAHADQTSFAAKLDGVKTYMRIRKVPKNIQMKVIKWFDYLWMSQKNSDEDKSISCLPGAVVRRARGRLMDNPP
jgi:hypothetical protein